MGKTSQGRSQTDLHSNLCVCTLKKTVVAFVPKASQIIGSLSFQKRSLCSFSQGTSAIGHFTAEFKIAPSQSKREKGRWKLGKKTPEEWKESTAASVFSWRADPLLFAHPTPQTGLTPIYLWCLTTFCFIFPFTAPRRLPCWVLI